MHTVWYDIVFRFFFCFSSYQTIGNVLQKVHKFNLDAPIVWKAAKFKWIV